MKKNIVHFAGVLLIAITLSACSSMKNRDVGAISGATVGAVAGGLIGHGNVAGAAVGAVAGGLGGYYIGKSTENN